MLIDLLFTTNLSNTSFTVKGCQTESTSLRDWFTKEKVLRAFEANGAEASSAVGEYYKAIIFLHSFIYTASHAISVWVLSRMLHWAMNASVTFTVSIPSNQMHCIKGFGVDYIRFFKGVLGTRFRSLESEISCPYQVRNIFLKKNWLY